MQRQEVRQSAPQQLLEAGSDVTAAVTQEGVRFVRAVSVGFSHSEIRSKGQPEWKFFFFCLISSQLHK